MPSSSPIPPRDAPTVAVLASCDRILSGYRHADFPDLSSRRFAPDELYSTSQAIAHKLGSNVSALYPAVVAALGRVLGAYCGCQDILLGLAVDSEDQVLPIRISWGEGQTWEASASRVVDAIADPFWPRVHPDVLRRVLDISSKQSPASALVSASSVSSPGLASHFPLAVAFDSLTASVSVTTTERVFHPAQSALFLSQVAALVQHAGNAPKSSLARLPQLPSHLISSFEKQDHERISETYRFVPPTKLATDHLAARAAETPDAVAVQWYPDLSTDVPISTYTSVAMSYAELERKTNQFGRWLLQLGLRKGRSVAICMKRDIWYHIAFLGALKAGGCYVPIDPELPTERQVFIAKDSDAQFILSTSDLPCFASISAIDVNELGIRSAIEAQATDILSVPGPDDLSYILYTSGTTGTPKGCILTHLGLSEAIRSLSHICAAAELAPYGRGNYLSIASVAFDVHLAEIFVALALGIPILSAPRALLLEDLPYYIKHLRISHVGIVPSLIEATMGAVQEDQESGATTTLRYIASGGEKMSDAILDKWASHPQVRLANYYGPSEVTIGCAARVMDKDTPRANIGHTFLNVSSYVVDEDMNIVLRGGTGELVVEGPLVGRGYVGRPDLTEKVFLKFPNDSPDRWAYRTGDLVRMMPDSTLEIIGRIDTQIKLRGVRIESEGISNILRNAGAPEHTLDVITILSKHSAIGIDQLVSFIAWDTSVPIGVRKGGKPSVVAAPDGLLSRLRAACDRELASYMRPSHIVPLDFIPLSSNGKADAKVLAALFLGLDIGALTGLWSGGQKTAHQQGERQPTETEKKVLEVLESFVAIPVERFGPHTNLFECGMHSLAVAGFAAELRRAFDVKIAPARIMQSPLVSEIAGLLETESWEIVSHDAASAVDKFVLAVREDVEAAYAPGTIAAILPPLPVQEGVLYRSTNSPTMYCQHVLLRLGSDVLPSHLKAAWKEVVQHHDMLRTVFYFGNELVQVILHPDAVDNQDHEKEVSSGSDDDFRRYFTEEEASAISRDLNVNLSTTPPVRLSFFIQPQTGVTYMVLSLHHALYDGISLPVLIDDLERAYSHQPQLPSAPLRNVLEQITTIDQDAAHSFWTSHLKDYPWNKLLRKTASSSSADIESLTFKQPLSVLQAKAAGQHVTLQAFLMCAYGSLLAQHLYGHNDVVFGVIRAGRSIPVDDIATTICSMITVVPARVRLSDPSKALRDVQRDVARASEYEHIPLSRIQKWIPECAGSLFDTLFSVSFKDMGSSKLWTMLESQNPEPDYILATEVVLDPAHDEAVVHAAFTSADICRPLVQQILSQLEDTASRIAEGSQLDLPILSDAPGVSPHLPTKNNAAEAEDLTKVDQDVVSQIITIASQFLRLENLITADASLLSLGLDSIKSVGLSRRFSTQGLRLTSADIMRLSTPLRLAAFVQRSKTSTQREERLVDSEFAMECSRLKEALDVEQIKLSADDVVKVFPTSVLQAGMLSQTIGSHGRLYVHLFPLRLAADIEVPRLKDAWSRAIASFDILRTSFHFLPNQGVWTQVVHSTCSVQWSEAQRPEGVDLTEALNPFLKINDEGQMFARPPIYLKLLRAASFKEPAQLVVVLHHALYDGLAIAELFDAVQRLYRGDELPTTAHFHQLLPRILWQERNGTSFWVDRLCDLRNAPLLRKAVDSPVVHHVSLPVPLAETEIRGACSNAQVTPQCIGQVAFAKLLAISTQRRDVVFGRVVSGRDMLGAEGVVGPMLNTLPCRVHLPDISNKALLQQVHEANVVGMSWQHASLRSVQQKLNVASLWDSLFVYQPRQESPESRADRLWVFDAADEVEISIHYPLNIELHETKAGFEVQAACLSDVADEVELQKLVEQYASMLLETIRRPDEAWSTGLPTVPTEPTLTRAEVDPDHCAEGEAGDWDGHLNKFREVLSATVKVPESNIQPSTFLATLGIDSITAVQISAKARRIGLRLTSADVVQSRTVADLLRKVIAVDVAAMSGTIQVSSSPTIDIPQARWASIISPSVIGSVERVTLTSAGMEWMVGMWQQSHGSRFQHVFGYRLPSDVDPSRLRTSWDQLIDRHTILRSTFAYDTETGSLCTVIFKSTALALSMSQENYGPSKDPIEIVNCRMKELVSRPPPVDRPITRAVFLQFPRANYLVLHLHHFQYDAWSLQLIVDDLSCLYADQKPRSSNDISSFVVFAVSSNQAERDQMQYWKSAFRGDHAPLFPALVGAGASTERGVYTDRAAISRTSKLDEIARSQGVSLQNVFLACWAQVQAKHTKTDTPVFSLWHSGRTGDLNDIDRMAVPCINVLPLRTPCVQPGDTLALARCIQEELQGRSATVEQSRLVKVHEWAGCDDGPLSNVFVNIVKTAPEVEEPKGALLRSLDIPYFIPEVPPEATAGIDSLSVTKFIKDDIMIDIIMVPETDQIAVSIEFAGSVLDISSAKLLVAEWSSLVNDALQ